MATTGHESEIIQVQGLKAALKDGGNKGLFNEATCSTAAATAAKTVTAPTSFSLVSGATIIVKFTNAISVASATLKVGSTDAKPIYYRGAALAKGMVAAGDRLILRYNGTQYDILGNLNTDTTYSVMSASGTNHKGGLVPDPGATQGTTKYLREDGTWTVPDKSDKADKDTDAVAGNIAKFDANGNPVDAGIALTDVAQKATTLAGYGISDAYTKSETYTKTEVNGLVDTPHQEYVTVTATSSTTAATDVLPASGQSADTIYRVSNWNGNLNSGAGAFDATSYSEYAWDDISNPNKYVFLCVKPAIGEVFDISAYNNSATYADLSAALGSGANVPQTLQKGGMSVKFVQSSDNKYVKFFCTAQNFTTDVAQWQGVDNEPNPGSENLSKSGSVFELKNAIYKNLRFPISASPGWASEDFVTTSIEDNKAVISIDSLQSGGSWVVFSVRIGTVAALKQVSAHLYFDNILPGNTLFITKNWSTDWSRNTVEGWIVTQMAEEGGFRIDFPDSMYAELNDSDILYFMHGTSAQLQQKIEVFVTEYEMDSYNSEQYNKIDKNEEDINKILNYLNTNLIIAWGDSLTMGYGFTPYPAFVEEKLSNYKVINCGVGGETISTIMARQGSDVALTPNSIVLPASKDSKVLVADGTTENYLTSAMDGKIITPLLEGAGGYGQWTSNSVNPCFINGIKCQLSLDNGSVVASENKWYLNRTDNGDRDVTIPAGTPIILSGEANYGKSAGVIIFVGQNGGYDNTADLIEKIGRMIKQVNTSRYVIVGTYTSVDISKEAALQSAFGMHYFNSRVYLSTNAIYDVGLTPTQDDLGRMAQGLIPKSFWASNSDNIHMNTYGYKALGYMIANLLKAQGM